MIQQILDFIWQHKIEIGVTIPYITRAFHSLTTGGGIVGMFKAILFGTNTPKQKTTKKQN